MTKLVISQIHEGAIFYSPTAKAFFQLRKARANDFMCGGFTTWFDVASQNLVDQPLSPEFIANSVYIESIDQCDFAELAGNTWKVKEPTP